MHILTSSLYPSPYIPHILSFFLIVEVGLDVVVCVAHDWVFQKHIIKKISTVWKKSHWTKKSPFAFQLVIPKKQVPIVQKSHRSENRQLPCSKQKYMANYYPKWWRNSLTSGVGKDFLGQTYRQNVTETKTFKLRSQGPRMCTQPREQTYISKTTKIILKKLINDSLILDTNCVGHTSLCGLPQ